MPTELRIATFNVENLFDRPKLLNLDDHAQGDQKLQELRDFRAELQKPAYDKQRILELYAGLKDYITVLETRQKLFNKKKNKVLASGRDDWEGWVTLKRTGIDDAARSNSAAVIKKVNAHITCLVEVENRPLLDFFSSQKLKGKYRYPYNMLVDGNDDRGIDVALLSRLPLRGLWTHIYDKKGNKTVFSRDCLEVRLEHPDGFELWVLINHFKSKGYSGAEGGNAKRRMQAERVAEILTSDYDLKKDLVVVAGDLNDTPTSEPLAPLVRLADLHDVLALQFPNAGDRWTYHYKTNEQIDFLLVSTPLRDAFREAGVERGGIHKVEDYTTSGEESYPTVTSYRTSASDHGAVWAEFQL